MTKLTPKTKPVHNIHTMRDTYKAQKHLSKLIDILDTPPQNKLDLEVISYLKKKPLREVDV